MEEEWFARVTYPTGIFKSEWLRQAADVDALIPRAIPAGVPGLFLQGPNAPLVLSSTRFTALGPAPVQMTGCSGCYDYTKTEGRVNDIVVDPTTTTTAASCISWHRWRRRLENDELLQQFHDLARVTDDPLICHHQHRFDHDRSQQSQHDLRRHRRSELRFVLDGQPGHSQVD